MSLVRLSQIRNINDIEFRISDVLTFQTILNAYLKSNTAFINHAKRGHRRHTLKVLKTATLVVPVQLSDIMLIPRGDFGSLNRLINSYYFWVKDMLKHVEGVISCS